MESDGLLSTVMPRPAVTLTFDLLTLKSNQHIYEPKYICDQNWVKFPSLVLRYKFFGTYRLQACGLGLILVSAIYVSCLRRYFRPNCASHVNKMSQISSHYLWQC